MSPGSRISKIIDATFDNIYQSHTMPCYFHAIVYFDAFDISPYLLV
jgi:hypothetical protein